MDAEPDLEVTFDQYDLFAGKDLPARYGAWAGMRAGGDHQRESLD
jgi:hypothetical protein